MTDMAAAIRRRSLRRTKEDQTFPPVRAKVGLLELAKQDVTPAPDYDLEPTIAKSMA
jgi:hypothetical protein